MIETAADQKKKKKNRLHQQLNRDEQLMAASGNLSTIFTDLCLTQRWRRVAVIRARLHVAVL